MSVSDGFEGITQLVASAVDVRFDSSKRQIERRGDLFVGSAFDVPEHDTGTVFRPQTGNGALDGRPELPGFHLFERIFLPGLHIERGGLLLRR